MSLIICVYMYVSWSGVSLTFSLWIPISVFGYVVTDCTCIGTSVSWYIIGKSACIRTSLDSYFFVSLCFWMCEAVSDYIIAYCRCKCTSLDSRWSLSFLSECFYPCPAILSLWVYRYVSSSPFVSLSLSVSVSVSECIIGNSYVCDQSRSARSACNTHYKRIQSLIQNHMPMCSENSAIVKLFLIF